jgi:hypothetical protein
VGDDWAEDHHDVEVVDDDGQVLARRGLPNGLDGIAVLHALIGEHLPEGWADWEPADCMLLRSAAARSVRLDVLFQRDRGPSRRWCWGDVRGSVRPGRLGSVVRCPGRPSFGSTWPFLGDAVCSLRRMTTDAANGDE